MAIGLKQRVVVECVDCGHTDECTLTRKPEMPPATVGTEVADMCAKCRMPTFFRVTKIIANSMAYKDNRWRLG